MQISNQTQRSDAAYGFSETLMAQTQFQLQALDGSTSTGKPNTPADQVSLSPGALTMGRANGQNDQMASLLGMMENILQQVLGTTLSTVAATSHPSAADKAGQSSGSQNAPSSPLDQLTSSILSALQGDNGSHAAQSGGNQDSLLSALGAMGKSVENDAMSLFNNLSAQNQSAMNGMVSDAAAHGASGSYQSLVSVQESESYQFSASGKLTTASGQTFQFSLQVELQASVSITSSQSGVFGPSSQNTAPQSLQLGQQAGLFSGANVNFDSQNLQKSNPTGDDKAAKTDDSAATSAATIGQAITSALATLKLTPEKTDDKQTPQQQQVSALMHRKHGRHAHGAGHQANGTATPSSQTSADSDTPQTAQNKQVTAAG
ncbi:hypothetical protein [Paludibacterium purpuratum]|uniref:Uncharacterized protein n=1 Tax=Paludibacterium purpuratum TaxID=1144873 RepID=A0A4R7BC47_9NEIS|nr:hypothetical protein [Paludibacterium purpuratum]TDR81475.1 hypothetical protein DFP86_103128 [Paludibacterium purpuratum]